MSRLLGTDIDDEDVEYEDYLLGKCRIKGEYKKEFTYIENYYMELYRNSRYVEMALKQVVQDLQRAQEEEKAVNSVTGAQTWRYADTTIKKVMERERGHRGILWELARAALIVLCIMLTQIFKGDHYQYSFFERLNHLYIGVSEILILVMIYIITLGRRMIAGFLFYRPSIMTFFLFLNNLIIYLAIISFIRWERDMPLERFCENYLRVPLPLYIFFAVGSLATMFLIYKAGKRSGSEG
ncbi:MAG TPA: hypothetical protein VHQ24_08145 [Lachnospiraceae bacterium]|nr:hypothetical protein [Lachnospiraceae bacterium]